MHSKQEEKLEKQVYKKPRLRVIELVGEEVLAAGCKLLSGTLTDVGNPFSCTQPTGCFDAGS